MGIIHKKDCKIQIYGLKCPVSNLIEYVGATSNVKERYYNHTKNTTEINGGSNKSIWIKSLIAQNKTPELILIELCEFNEFEHKEKYWINYYREINTNLKNQSTGGIGSKGVVHKKETIEKRTKSYIESCKNRTPEKRAEIGRAISLRQIGIPKSEEAVKNRSIAVKKYWDSLTPEEVKAKTAHMPRMTEESARKMGD